MTPAVLVSNGIDIQIGGMDFLNKWIIVRLLADAKAGKYDELFKESFLTVLWLTGGVLQLQGYDSGHEIVVSVVIQYAVLVVV